MTIASDCISDCQRLYKKCIQRVGTIHDIAKIELVVIDLMLQLAYLKPENEAGRSWEDIARRSCQCVKQFLDLHDVQIVIACFDISGLNVAKVPAQRKRYKQKESDESRDWRYHELIPHIAEYMALQMVIPTNKTLIVDLGDTAVFLSGFNHHATQVDRSLIHITSEADFRMFNWIFLPEFSQLSAGIYSVDGDELVTGFLLLPECQQQSFRRRITWIRPSASTAAQKEIQLWDLRLLDDYVRRDFLKLQLHIQNAKVENPSVEITDYRSVFVSFFLMRGCDFVEPFNKLTFSRLFEAFFTFGSQFGGFIFATIDSETRERTFHLSYEMYRQFIHSAYGLVHRYDPLKYTLEQVQEDAQYEDIPDEETIRLHAARLRFALTYMANSWNRRARVPDPLERAPDPLNPDLHYSIYGLELDRPELGISFENVRLAKLVIV